MELLTWLQENDSRVDWQIFAGPWAAMQRKHNPFRDDQINSILDASAVLDVPRPNILDLGCGPGILGSRILGLKPDAQYYGVDGDPLMLSAMQHLLPARNVHPVLVDIRTVSWELQYREQFDAAISLTALHWLSRDHLKQLYKAVYAVLKPGCRLVVGDPYLPTESSDKAKRKTVQDEKSVIEKGSTWNEFWTAFFDRYPIKELYTQYHVSLGYQEPFEGSDDGYPATFYKESLAEAGFEPVSIYWMSGLRIVYGGTKPPP
jgi:SAM-dependent methyltransferase